VKLQVAQAKMVDDAAGLQGQIDSLAGQVAAEEEKRRGLAERSGAGGGTQEQTLHELNQKVAEVYKAIFSESDNSLGTLQMLTNIESRLEELLAAIDTMPQDEVEAAQRHVDGRWRAWRPDEDLVLLLMFRNGAGWSRIAEALPGRAGKEVLSRMSQLQVKHGFSASDEGRLVLDSLLLACGIDETA